MYKVIPAKPETLERVGSFFCFLNHRSHLLCGCTALEWTFATGSCLYHPVLSVRKSKCTGRLTHAAFPLLSVKNQFHLQKSFNPSLATRTFHFFNMPKYHPTSYCPFDRWFSKLEGRQTRRKQRRTDLSKTQPFCQLLCWRFSWLVKSCVLQTASVLHRTKELWKNAISKGRLKNEEWSSVERAENVWWKVRGECRPDFIILHPSSKKRAVNSLQSITAILGVCLPL